MIVMIDGGEQGELNELESGVVATHQNSSGVKKSFIVKEKKSI